MKTLEDLIKDKDNNNVYKYIITPKKRGKKVKNDINNMSKIVELREIGLPEDIISILLDKKLDKENKEKINKYLKNMINKAYDTNKFNRNYFFNVIDIYIYGFENSLTYFRTLNIFVKNDISIKLLFLKNVLRELPDETISGDILFMKELFDEKYEIEENESSDNISNFTYSSNISRVNEIMERDKDILQIENSNLQDENQKLRDENNKLKNKIERLQKQNKLAIAEKEEIKKSFGKLKIKD